MDVNLFFSLSRSICACFDERKEEKKELRRKECVREKERKQRMNHHSALRYICSNSTTMTITNLTSSKATNEISHQYYFSIEDEREWRVLANNENR